MSNGTTDQPSANAKRLLWAGFMAILAAGVGFAIRGGILNTWGAQFGFSAQQLGDINGAGFTGFCFGIVIGGLLCDRIGYGKLVIGAFIFHVSSAFLTLSPTEGMNPDAAFKLLYWGSFIFAVANGTLEAVANPLIATLFFHNRTHYLNILHASWPAGLILGGTAGAILGQHWHWKSQMALFLVPTALYGLMFLGQHMPKSEASAKGLKLGDMMKDIGILGSALVCLLLGLFLKSVLGPFFPPESNTPLMIAIAISGVLFLAAAGITRLSIGAFLLFGLFIAHALVGAVELGTDGWIQSITGNILDPVTGKWLFVYTSFIMFSLRFCADFIEKKIGLSPVGILLVCSVLACLGLNLISAAQTTVMVMLALAVYAVGKTFFWPTMLAVASDRFPRTGAIAISFMGGIGMMSAGLIGSPGLGYCKDRYTSEELQKANPAIYAEYKSTGAKGFLFFEKVQAVDGRKLGEAQAAVPAGRTEVQKVVVEANMKGDRRTLKTDSFLPAAMAVIYLIVLFYFRTIGGYKPIHIDETAGAAKPST